MELNFICIRLEAMAYFGPMYPVFDKITKRNALYAVITRVGAGY
jgi:hypothetical protein